MKIAGQAFVQQSSKYPSHEAAYAAGAEAMRERAAKVCEHKFSPWPGKNTPHMQELVDLVNELAADIRALPLTESKP